MTEHRELSFSSLCKLRAFLRLKFHSGPLPDAVLRSLYMIALSHNSATARGLVREFDPEYAVKRIQNARHTNRPRLARALARLHCL